MDLLKDSTLREMTLPQFYDLGLLYYSSRQVRNLQKAGRGAYTAEIGSAPSCRVYVSLTPQEDDLATYRCTCPVATADRICPHVIAVLKAIQSGQQGGNPARAAKRDDTLFRSGSRMLELFQSKPAAAKAQSLRLEPHLHAIWDYSRLLLWLEFKIGAGKLYVLKNILGFLQCAEQGEPVEFGKGLTVDTATMRFEDETSQGLWQMMRRSLSDLRSTRDFSWQFNRYGAVDAVIFQQKRYLLTPSRMGEFLALMGDRPFGFQHEDEKEYPVQVVHGNPKIHIAVEDMGGAGRIALQSSGLYALDVGYRFLLMDGSIYITNRDFQSLAAPFFRSFSGHPDGIHMSKDDMPRFLGDILPKLETIADVRVADKLASRYLLEPLRAELYLDYEKGGDGIEVKALFRYGESVAFNPLVGNPPAKTGRQRLVREEAAEQRILAVFDAYGFSRERGLFVQSDEEKAYDFLKEALPGLSEQADVFYADVFHRKPVQSMPRITAGVSVNSSNLLEVTFRAQDIDFDEIIDILASYRHKRRYHRLKDGTFVTLAEQQLGAIADLAEATGIKKGMAVDGQAVELPLSQAMYLDALAREDEGLRLERSPKFRSIVRDIRHPADADFEVPASLAPVLRDYQATGFNWLSTLASYGLGGILADDMGLGKTIQVLAFLLSRQGKEKAPALVVAPTSLLYNWADEIERFAPALKSVVIGGTKDARTALLEELDGGTDLAITTYNMLARDIDIYRKKTFSYCILDEAQHIKNPSTQKAKAVKLLRAGVCFALTGTPIENTLTELWSIFDFLMPGYLLGHTKFKQRYETPIVRGEDEHAAKDLKRHVTPFVLRRLKRDVLQELPDKVERRLLNEMTEEQGKVYRAYFVQAKKEFADELRKHGLGESRIKILALLTRLRQIACDPSLFLEGYAGGSGKLELLEEVVTDAIAAGHRMLVFSQFTTMLQHIAGMLKRMGAEYLYLDGQTPSMERMRLVKQFNEGTAPLFLISLKAGGTGLNLTGADMVIHFDPWWNPAVEDQATDRAYRLGQKNNVQVLKLITKDTIEERIYELQERKKSLIDKMIEPGENFLSKLTDEEIQSLFQ